MADSKVKFEGDAIAKKVAPHFEKVLQKCANEWKTDISMVSCHGDYGKIPQDQELDKLYIYVQLLPKEFSGISRGKVDKFVLNGEEVVLPVKEEDGEIRCPQGEIVKFSKAPAGAKIVKDDKNTPIAVIFDDALYFVSDFIHCCGEGHLETSIKVFDYVMDQAVNKNDFLAFLKAGLEEKSKRALCTALKDQFKIRLDKERKQVQAAKQTVNQYEKGIVDATRKLLASEKITVQIEKNLEDVPKALDKTWKEINKLADSPAFEEISFTKTGLKAVTKDIDVDWKKNQYNMGRYEITLKFTGNTHIVSLDNRNVDGFAHPHVSGGAPCWGNLSGAIPKMIGASQFDVALLTIHTFLTSYDDKNPHRKIESWDKFKVAGVKTKKK